MCFNGVVCAIKTRAMMRKGIGKKKQVVRFWVKI